MLTERRVDSQGYLSRATPLESGSRSPEVSWSRPALPRDPGQLGRSAGQAAILEHLPPGTAVRHSGQPDDIPEGRPRQHPLLRNCGGARQAAAHAGTAPDPGGGLGRRRRAGPRDLELHLVLDHVVERGQKLHSTLRIGLREGTLGARVVLHADRVVHARAGNAAAAAPPVQREAVFPVSPGRPGEGKVVLGAVGVSTAQLPRHLHGHQSPVPPDVAAAVAPVEDPKHLLGEVGGGGLGPFHVGLPPDHHGPRQGVRPLGPLPRVHRRGGRDRPALLFVFAERGAEAERTRKLRQVHGVPRRPGPRVAVVSWHCKWHPSRADRCNKS